MAARFPWGGYRSGGSRDRRKCRRSGCCADYIGGETVPGGREGVWGCAGAGVRDADQAAPGADPQAEHGGQCRAGAARAGEPDDEASGAVPRVQQLAEQNKIEERKLVLLEKKAELADKAKGLLGDKALTEEERAGRMRELFGM